VVLLSRRAAGGPEPSHAARDDAPRRTTRTRLCFKNEAVYWRRRAAVLAVPLLVVLAPSAPAAARATLGTTGSIPLRSSGIEDGAVVTPAALGHVTLAVGGRGGLGSVTVSLDDRPVATEVSGRTITLRLPPLADGEHVVRVARPRRLGLPAQTRTFAFTVDGTPPTLTVDDPPGKAALGQPVVVTGTVEAGATVTSAGRAVKVAGGRFELRFDAPPSGAEVTATDAAGNTTTVPVVVPVDVPSTRAVHVSGFGWADRRFRDPVLAMGERGLIDTVQLDLKEEDGLIDYRSDLERPKAIGAVRGLFDLKTAVDDLHARHLRVVGRIVAFRDPVLAGSAWKAGQRNEVIQTPEGAPWAGYGGFTNFADPAVRKYVIDIAEEAARAGVDDILYDYVRRPDGPLEKMRFVGLTGTPEQGIAAFLAESRARLRPLGVYQGASVYGISVDRPTQIAQDLTQMAPNVDYLAPMVYPSHWNKGEYGVADPNRSPYDIVQRSLAKFQAKVAGTDVKIIPWLQDFSLGVTYGPAEVAAQIKAAADVGITSWFLWDPAVTYTEAGIPPRP
jgi:hypothetical protein